ncbi:MAG TPA: hypothetical protein VN452_07180 [Longilinea sp.]|nr:hypothetical protein [Longilinea sp.]
MNADHSDNTAEEKPEVETAVPLAAETIQMPEGQHHSWFYSILHFLFGADTSVGRFMRPLLRWTAFVLILFSAGLLAMYFWRVRPAENLLTKTAGELAAAQAELTGARDEVSASRSKVSDMQTRMQTAEAAATSASQHLLLTTLRNDIAAARIALIADKDTAAAILSISNAELDLTQLVPAINQFNDTLANELKDNLARIKKGLDTRPVNQTGLADQLFSFDVKLLGLEELMFPK